MVGQNKVAKAQPSFVRVEMRTCEQPECIVTRREYRQPGLILDLHRR